MERCEPSVIRGIEHSLKTVAFYKALSTCQAQRRALFRCVCQLIVTATFSVYIIAPFYRRELRLRPGKWLDQGLENH